MASRWRPVGLIVALMGVTAVAASSAQRFGVRAFAPVPQLAVPTYSKDVAPIIQKNCQDCHRQGEAAPFKLNNCEDATAWAEAIREAVTDKRMPPWYSADKEKHKFKNDRTLSDEFFHDLIDEHFSEEESRRQLETAIQWGRYAEIFDYDAATGKLTLTESSLPETAGA